MPSCASPVPAPTAPGLSFSSCYMCLQVFCVRMICFSSWWVENEFGILKGFFLENFEGSSEIGSRRNLTLTSLISRAAIFRWTFALAASVEDFMPAKHCLGCGRL